MNISIPISTNLVQEAEQQPVQPNAPHRVPNHQATHRLAAEEKQVLHPVSHHVIESEVAVSVPYSTPAAHHETSLAAHESTHRLHQRDVQSADGSAHPDRLSRLLRGENIELIDEELVLLRETCVTGYALLPLWISE